MRAVAEAEEPRGVGAVRVELRGAAEEEEHRRAWVAVRPRSLAGWGLLAWSFKGSGGVLQGLGS